METNQPIQKKLSARAVISTIILLLGLLALAYYIGITKKDNGSQTPPPPSFNEEAKFYSNPQYGIQFAYPGSFALIAGDSQEIPQLNYLKPQGSILTSVVLPKSLYTDSNLNQAFVTLAVTADTANCKQTSNTQIAELESSAKLGQNTFFFGDRNGAAAGNRYDMKVYHIAMNNFCFEFNANVQYGNINNYEPGTVTDINVQEIFDRLAKIIETTTFTKPTPVAAETKTYSNGQFSFNYPPKIIVGGIATNSVLGTANILVPGVYVGQYVFITLNSNKLRKEGSDYFNQMAEVAKNPPLQEEGFPTVACKLETVTNSLKIELVSCTGEGGPAVYGMIDGPNFDIFIDGYSRGWDGTKTFTTISYQDLVKILETFKF